MEARVLTTYPVAMTMTSCMAVPARTLLWVVMAPIRWMEGKIPTCCKGLPVQMCWKVEMERISSSGGMLTTHYTVAKARIHWMGRMAQTALLEAPTRT
ncbi:hypothetical protein ACZ75_17830 [Massilia sp. NR 4-1]|nr:hypothetical protein ACZ75_17830 [Massilia sp. NR 4-1]